MDRNVTVIDEPAVDSSENIVHQESKDTPNKVEKGSCLEILCCFICLDCCCCCCC